MTQLDLFPAKAATVDSLKSTGDYRQAGALAFSNGEPRAYGCHFGMRSTRAYAMSEFEAGYDAAKASAEKRARAGRWSFAYEVEHFDGMRTRVLCGFVQASDEVAAAEKAEAKTANERRDMANLHRYFCRRIERLNG